MVVYEASGMGTAFDGSGGAEWWRGWLGGRLKVGEGGGGRVVMGEDELGLWRKYGKQ